MSNVGIKGEYQAIVLDAQGNVKEDTGWFSNLLLDNFFTDLGVWRSNKWYPDTARTLRVGTGTTTPVATQTTLVNRVASTITKTSSTVQPQFTDGLGRVCQSMEETFAFALGSIVATVSEVGWLNFSDINGTTVHSRALITDVNGNPTSITLTAQDQLVVKYKITLVDIYKEGSGTLVLNGDTFNWVSRRSQKPTDSGGGWFGGLLGNGANNPSANVAGSTLYYGNTTFGAHGVAPVSGSGGSNASGPNWLVTSTTAGEFRVVASLSISQGNNANGIKCISTGLSYGYCNNKFEFTPAIPKTDQQVLNLTLAHTVSRL